MSDILFGGLIDVGPDWEIPSTHTRVVNAPSQPQYEIAQAEPIDFNIRPDLFFTPEHEQTLQRMVWEESLYDFLLDVWKLIEPGRPFSAGWHIQAICEHLQAVSNGEIRKLLINVPPRTTKSTLVSVVWPVWEWTFNPGCRWLISTYSDTLLSRDAIKARDIITSDWYQSNWGERVQLKDDQNTIHFYRNIAGGYRVSTTPKGAGTGFGGDRIVVDDPHNVRDKEHKSQIAERVNWWAKSMSTRFEDANTAAWVACGQRVDENDISAYCIEAGYEHLMIPMEYDANHAMFTKSPKSRITCLGWQDPRGPGQPREGDSNICPERFPEHVVNEMKLAMRIDAEAQLQQDPKPSEGGIFDISQFADPVEATPSRGRRVRYWDRAFTDDGGAFTVGVLVNYTGGIYYIEDVQRKQMSAARRNQFIKLIAARDAMLSGNTVQIYIEQEPSAGKESALILAQALSGYPVFIDKVVKNKLARAIPAAAQVAAGNVRMLKARWNTEFLNELEYFPNSKYKDQVDAFSAALNKLSLDSMQSIEGDMLMSGQHGDTGRLTDDDIRELAQVSPELADLVKNFAVDTTSARMFDDDEYDTNTLPFEENSGFRFRGAGAELFNDPLSILDEIAGSENRGRPESLEDIEQQITELLGGGDSVDPGEYTQQSFGGAAAWPWEQPK